MINGAGIDMAVLMCTVSPEFRFCFVIPEEALEISASFPDRLIPFANLDPRMLRNCPESDFRDLLQHYKSLGCKGIGEYFPNLAFDDPLNINVFKHVEEAGLPLTFHIAPKLGGCYGCFDEVGLPRLENVLKECPNLVFLGHSQAFWAEISSEVTDANRRGYPKGPVKPGRLVELMRRYPNLHGDLSANSGFNAISRDPEFGYQFMEEFQERLYFGTDIAKPGQNLPIVPYFRNLKAKELVSSEAYEKISWMNAARLLKLDIAPQAPEHNRGGLHHKDST